MEQLFWISGLLLVHTYVLYPWTLKLLTEVITNSSKELLQTTSWPKVSIVFSAFNEEGIIKKKMENLFTLDYPKDKLEFLIGSDGSTDNTNAILGNYKDKVKFFSYPKNRGKAAVINDLIPHAKGEIIIFCDANTFFLPNAIKVVSLPFQNPKTGCVSGRLILNDTGRTTLGEGESLYWQVESRIKELEGRLNILMGVNGAIYAIRPELFSKLPVNRRVTDDFYISVNTLSKGKHCTYVRQAIGVENTSISAMGEFHRKVRISQANFNFLPRYLRLLNPLKPIVAYSFFSHKLLRWFSPQLMICFWISNISLTFESRYFMSFWILQTAFYLLALIGYVFDQKKRRLQILSLPYYFVAMNYALLLGLFQSLNPIQGGGWERIERDE